MPIDSGNLALKGLDDLFSTEENRQEYDRMKAREYRARRKAQAATAQPTQ